MSKQSAWCAVLFALICVLSACDRKPGDSTPSSSTPAATAPVNEPGPAVEARTAAALLQQEVAGLETSTRQTMGKLISEADAKRAEGDTCLNEQRYDDAARDFGEAAALYQRVLDGRAVLEQLTSMRQEVAEARQLAELGADAEQLRPVRHLELNAEGYIEAGDFVGALAELGKAREAYTALAPAVEPAKLEDAVAARTAMLTVREQVTPQSRQVKSGTLPDLLASADAAEAVASRALDQRRYTASRELFAKAEASYRAALEAQSGWQRVAAASSKAREQRELAESAYHTTIRPASYERGKQLFADAGSAAIDANCELAETLFASAAEQFTAAWQEVATINEVSDAQQMWVQALAGTDRTLVEQHAREMFDAAQAQAVEAETQVNAGDYNKAKQLYTEASRALAGAVAEAVTSENLEAAKPLIARLAQSVNAGDKFAAIPLLSQLQAMIPAEPRMADMERRVREMPWPAKNVIDLGNGVTMELILIRPGAFEMGSAGEESDEMPIHSVTITQPYYLGRTEVTQAQWQAVMGSNPSKFKDAPNPVEQVSWNDCQAFVRKLSRLVEHRGRFCLPTEAQWEYACRAGNSATYFFGEDESLLTDYAWYKANALGKPRFVGAKKPNAWGLYDMSGNVWEWCADWHGLYSDSDAIDPTGPVDGTSRIIRGGGYPELPRGCRTADRHRDTSDHRSSAIGFRVAIDLLDIEPQATEE
ncbi:MAG: SUMF1/EgtB/PvdO family nonheme iron enzyme [Phycisphaeraceae bacterium]|nr:SUMF1/EgtB/PvdO family nonheme iron enzyme [Phycisphaeraceae bacterium]